MLFLEGGKLRVRLIREGVSKNRRRWTRAILDKVAQLSEGKPLHFYDASQKGDGSHLTHWEFLRQRLPPGIRSLLPERLPGAEIATLRNPTVVTEGDGKAAVVADVQLNEGGQWFRPFLEKLIALGRSIGVSIHSKGPATIDASGVTEPTDITDVVGYDVVTHPSAGGRFMPVLEALLEERKMKDLLKRLLRFVPEDKRGLLPTLEGEPEKLDQITEAWRKKFEELSGITLGESADTVLEGLYSVPDSALEAVSPKPAKTAQPKKAAKAKPQGGQPGDGDALEGRLSEVEKRLADQAKASSLSLVRAKVTEAKLPGGLADFAKSQLEAMVESQGFLEEKAIDEFLAGLKKGVGQEQDAGGASMLEAVGGMTVELGNNGHDRVIAAFDGMLEGQAEVTVGQDKEKVPAFRSIKHAYIALTGDVLCEGLPHFYRARKRGLGAGRLGLLEAVDFEQLDLGVNFAALHNISAESILEAISTASFPLLLSDRQHKRLAKEYSQLPQQWRYVGAPEPVSDFKTWRVLKMGEYANLPTVAEGANYQPVADTPSEEEITLQIAKYGGLETLTWETIVNDDTRKVRRAPQKLARAALRTLEYAVFDPIINNSAIYDTVALAHALSHNNLQTTGAIFDVLKTMRKQMSQQKDLDSREAGRVRPVGVLCGPEQYDALYEVIYGPNKPTLGANDNQSRPNVLRGKWGLTLYDAVHRFDDLDPDQFWMLADPAVTEMVAVAFLNGRETPEMFVQDLERVGSFFDAEKITWKVRHIWDVVVTEYRGFQAYIAP